MRVSHVAIVYFIMGVVIVGTGVLPVTQLGIASVFMDVNGTNVSVDESTIGGQEGTSGMVDGLMGPVKNALNTITGGALIAVWNPLSKLLGFIAWPVVVTNELNAPQFVVMLSGVLVASFTFGVFRVFRASI